jgi:hypothetical protein
MNGLTRHGLSWRYYFLNLVFELKFLNVFMGREDPIEFDSLVEACSFYRPEILMHRP